MDSSCKCSITKKFGKSTCPRCSIRVIKTRIGKAVIPETYYNCRRVKNNLNILKKHHSECTSASILLKLPPSGREPNRLSSDYHQPQKPNRLSTSTCTLDNRKINWLDDENDDDEDELKTEKEERIEFRRSLPQPVILQKLICTPDSQCSQLSTSLKI